MTQEQLEQLASSMRERATKVSANPTKDDREKYIRTLEESNRMLTKALNETLDKNCVLAEQLIKTDAALRKAYKEIYKREALCS
jgi:Zn-dependent oligopeptidase